MTAISTRPPRTAKPAAMNYDRSEIIVAPDITRTLALDAGNYDLKYWDGVSVPRAYSIDSISGTSRAGSGEIFRIIAFSSVAGW